MKHSRLILILGVILIPLMITNESLWLDEACTALFAIRPDFHSWRAFLAENTSSDAQMPLSMFLAWVTDKLIGSAEWQLRAINALWAFIALLGVWRAGRILRLPALPLALLVQPYFWYYTNEARPYALQTAAGAWLLVAIVQFWETRGAGHRWAVTLTFSAVALIYATMLAPVAIISVLLPVGVIAARERWRIGRPALVVLGWGALAALPAAVYYFGTLAKGANGSRLWAVDAKTPAYVIYETIGLNGLGPPIDHLRELAATLGLTQLLTSHAPQFLLAGLGALTLALVVGLGSRRHLADAGEFPLGLAGWPVVIGVGFFFVVSMAIHKAFWARHLAPLFPFYVAFLGIAATHALRRGRGGIARLAVGLALALLVLSCFTLRFSPAYRKENYRRAAQLTTAALREGKSVWWVASRLNATYYGVATSESAPVANEAAYTMQTGVPASMVALTPTAKMPDLVVVNHRIDFDNGRQAHVLVDQGRYEVASQFTGFTILARKPEAPLPEK